TTTPSNPASPADAKPVVPPVTIPPPAGETTARYSGRATPQQYELAKIAVARAHARGLGETVENPTALTSGQRDLYHLCKSVLDGGKTPPPPVAPPTPTRAQSMPKPHPAPLAVSKPVPLPPALGQPMTVTPYSPSPTVTATPAPLVTGTPAATR